MGAGNFTVDSTVPQSTPSAPMTCVPNSTVPDRTAAPPLFRRTSVTSSHHRRAPASRKGAPTSNTAGPTGPGEP
ncbi:hypothetical protein [Streptomyces sp. NRRL B-1347]|uniref:hypothetical protein n=1 Tax=Streptomyces sp. NRRL B-1347 TaxID=1476877 RepID=UPI000AB48CA8|nr:hypothetical protein [Streptomyces sp. NRRL B-1347]